MARAILEFDLPEEENEFKMAQRGRDYFCVIHEALREIRTQRKYQEPSKEALHRLEIIEAILFEAPLEDIE